MSHNTPTNPGSAGGAFAVCPKCNAAGEAERVIWTLWGGMIGPAILCHVRCLRCGAYYNGRTGKDNTVGIVVFLAAVPTILFLLVGCACLVAGFAGR